MVVSNRPKDSPQLSKSFTLSEVRSTIFGNFWGVRISMRLHESVFQFAINWGDSVHSNSMWSLYALLEGFKAEVKCLNYTFKAKLVLETNR